MSTSLFSVLLLGLLAGGVSCAAVQGGLLAGLVSRQRPSAPPPVRPRPNRTHPAEPPARLSDDLAPVAGFLTGKLASHAVLGALLGLAGTAVQLSVHIRAMVQLAAGIAIIAMGLAQLGVRGFTRLTFQPPTAWTRLVRGRARSQAAFAPALLGVSSILIPCGVTLSVMALAITSGSPTTGAAVMAVFVIGTAPLFTLLGYAAARARRAAGPSARRLAIATGVLILIMGAYTLNGGLELTGSPLAASQLATTLGLTADPAVADTPTPGSEVTIADGHQTVIVTAATTYQPGNLQIQAGLPTTLIVRARRAEGCIRAFVIPSRSIQEILPVSGDTPINLGVLSPGVLRYTCGMGMYTGRLTIVEKTS